MVGPIGTGVYSNMYIIPTREEPPEGFRRTGHRRFQHIIVKPEYHIYFKEHYNTFLMRPGIRLLDEFEIIERGKIYL